MIDDLDLRRRRGPPHPRRQGRRDRRPRHHVRAAARFHHITGAQLLRRRTSTTSACTSPRCPGFTLKNNALHPLPHDGGVLHQLARERLRRRHRSRATSFAHTLNDAPGAGTRRASLVIGAGAGRLDNWQVRYNTFENAPGRRQPPRRRRPASGRATSAAATGCHRRLHPLLQRRRDLRRHRRGPGLARGEHVELPEPGAVLRRRARRRLPPRRRRGRDRRRRPARPPRGRSRRRLPGHAGCRRVPIHGQQATSFSATARASWAAPGSFLTNATVVAPSTRTSSCRASASPCSPRRSRCRSRCQAAIERASTARPVPRPRR